MIIQRFILFFKDHKMENRLPLTSEPGDTEPKPEPDEDQVISGNCFEDLYKSIRGILAMYAGVVSECSTIPDEQKL